MTHCPFLTTKDVEVPCFEECALYCYKGNGGRCPFLVLYNYKNSVSIDSLDYYDLQKDVAYIKEFYKEKEQESSYN